MVQPAPERDRGIRIGPAGWAYEDWAGVVYPLPRPRGFDPLIFVARFFDLIEVNSTFYRSPAAKACASWVERTADRPRFRFTAKLHRAFTHDADPRAREAEEPRFKAGIRPLAASGRLRALLAQFPHSFRAVEESWARIAELRERFADLPLVVEVRRAEWGAPECVERLRALGAGFCNIDQPAVGRGPGATLAPTGVATSSTAYVRFHGRDAETWFDSEERPWARYDWLYAEADLRPWVETIRALSATTEETHVVLNNHFRGKAVVNALMIRAMLEGRPVEAPEGLLAEYPAAAPFLAGPGQGRLFS